MNKETDKKLSTLMEETAVSAREIARGNGETRNILGIGITGATLLMNTLGSVEALPIVDQLKLNAAGLAIAGMSALGAERARRHRLQRAEAHEQLAAELQALNL
jgi:hypothetical protein